MSMKRRAASALLALSLMATGACTSPGLHTDGTATRPAGLASVRTTVETGIAEGRYPGAVFAIARGGRVLDLQAFGSSDVNPNVPMQVDSIFRTMSMTKPITAAAVMILVEERKLRLDEPIARLLPEFASFGVPGAAPLTLRHLLTHTSGIGFGTFPAQPITLEERVKETARRRMTVPTGSQWAYSGTEGPDVAARLVEVAAGEPYEHFVERRLFDPLKMKDTGYTLTLAQQKRLVGLYAAKNGKLSQSKEMIPPARYPSGGAGLYSTVPDYLRFAQMLAGNGKLGRVRVLTAASVEEMRRLQLPSGFSGLPQGMGYGLLMRHVADPAALKSPLPSGAYGWSGAYGTHFWVDPATDLSAVWMINISNAGGAGSPDALAFEKSVMEACSADRWCARR